GLVALSARALAARRRGAGRRGAGRRGRRRCAPARVVAWAGRPPSTELLDVVVRRYLRRPRQVRLALLDPVAEHGADELRDLLRADEVAAAHEEALQRAGELARGLEAVLLALG